MRYRPMVALAAFAALFWCSFANAEPIDVSAHHQEAIGTFVQFLKEDATPLSLDGALEAYAAGQYQALQRPVFNFGLGSNPVWLAFEAKNPEPSILQRRLSIETSWLDKIDIYFIRDGQLLDRYHLGDTKPFAQRPVDHRFFVVDHGFDPGNTTVLMRVETPDPMVVPIYLTSYEQAQTRNTFEAYSYGFVYGVLIALMAYNFTLYLSLRNARYILYSVYLACFIAMNVAYTGHGYEAVWPESPRWQLWSNLVLMVIYSISGLVFATQFLGTKQNFPRIHRAVMGSIFGVVAVSATAIIAGSHFAMVLIAFVYMIFFAPSMVFLGVVSVRAGVKFAKYFVFASIAAVTGSALAVLVVWGLIPYSVWAYRAIDIGMMIDATLLALALADQFRVNQEEKVRAELLAKIDPLTGMNNRRAFAALAAPLWNTGLRNNRNMAVILLDIDRFKSINDTYGHALGDDALVQIAQSITKIARRGDVTARWGGEEFIVFLPETSLSEAVFVAERIRTNLADIRLEYSGAQISFTASFGVAERGDQSLTLDELITIADGQLYQAKESGRDQVCSQVPG